MSSERRITRRIIDYWQEIGAQKDMPDESQIDSDMLGNDWRHCFLLQTRDLRHIEQFNFTYLGEGIPDAYKPRVLRRIISALSAPRRSIWRHIFSTLRITRNP